MKNFWYEWNDLIIPVFVFILIVACIIFGMVGSVVIMNISWNKGYCQTQKGLSPDHEFKWVFWGGCLLLLPDGTWVNAHNYLDMERFRLEGEFK